MKRGDKTPNMFPGWPIEDRFDGATYDKELDQVRLSGQLKGVRDAMATGCWWSLAALAARTGGSEAGVSARIRDLRKERFGSHKVERRRTKAGLWHYRMLD